MLRRTKRSWNRHSSTSVWIPLLFRGLGRSIPCLFPLSFNAKTQRKQNHNMCLFSYFHLWDRSESLLEWLVVSTKIEEFPSMPFIREMVLLPWVSCVQHQESKTRSWGNIQSQYFSVGKLLSVPIRLFSPVWDQLRSCPFSQTTLFYGRFQT